MTIKKVNTRIEIKQINDELAALQASIDAIGAPVPWTPTLTDLTNQATLSTADASYVRIGSQVTLAGRIASSSLGSATGTLYIGGLPFDVGAGLDKMGMLIVGSAFGLNITANQVVTGRLSSFVNVNHIKIHLWDLAAGVSNLQATEWSADGSIDFNMTYFTDDP